MARTIWACLLPVIFAGLFASASAQPQSEESAIRNLLEAYEAAFNSGDPAALAQLWDKEGDLISLAGGIFRGQEEIAAFFSEALSKNYSGSRFRLGIDFMRFLGNDVAVVDGTWNITGNALPQGYPSSGIYTQVIVRTDDGWRILAARPGVPLRGHTRQHGRKLPGE